MTQRRKTASIERCPPRFLDLAGRLADAASVVSRRYFRSCIKVIEKGNPILGIIDQRMIGERWVGAVGRATTYMGKKVTTRP